MKQCYNDYGREKFTFSERNLTKCDTVPYTPKSDITGFGSNSTLRVKGIHRICTGARLRVWVGSEVLRVSSGVEHL
jgi:hypothetical protein